MECFIITYKSFIRPHLDNDNIVYYQSTNDSFGKQLESVQYKAALTMTRAIKDTLKASENFKNKQTSA